MANDRLFGDFGFIFSKVDYSTECNDDFDTKHFH